MPENENVDSTSVDIPSEESPANNDTFEAVILEANEREELLGYEEESKVCSDEKKEEGISYKKLLHKDKESDVQELLERSSDDSDTDGPSSQRSYKNKWWFRERLVRKNWRVVLCSYLFVMFGFLLIVAGVVLEALQVVEVIRGLVLIVMGLVVLIPSGFAVVSVYLAARRCCSLSLSKIKFFSN